MMYTVKYKLYNSWFWQTIKDVEGDWIASDIPTPTRIIMKKDKTRLEIPLSGTEFLFSKERFFLIKKNMEKESGVNIILNEGD